MFLRKSAEMRFTLVQKFLAVFLVLVLGGLVSVSWVYYLFFSQHVAGLARKHQETAFDLVFDDLNRTIAATAPAVQRFIAETLADGMYRINTAENLIQSRDPSEDWLLQELPAVFARYRDLIAAMDRFASEFRLQRLTIYDRRGTTRLVFLRQGENKRLGVYLGQGETAAFVPFSTHQLTELGDQMVKFLSLEELRSLVQTALPAGVETRFDGVPPVEPQVGIGHLNGLATLRFRAPVRNAEVYAGLVTAEVGLRQEDIVRSARFSHTDINLFVGSELSLGTLPAYRMFRGDGPLAPVPPDYAGSLRAPIRIRSIEVEGNTYSQASMAVGDAERHFVLTANFPQHAIIEQRNRLLLSIGTVVLLLGVPGFLVSGFISGRVNRFVQQILTRLDCLARGEIPGKMTGSSRGEFAAIKTNFNALIDNYGETVRVARQIADGDLEVRVRARSDHDLLRSSLNAMADRLRQARASLEERVRERTAQLAESEERFRALVDNIPGVVYRCTPDEHWTMEYISEEIARLTGYPAADFIDNRVRSYGSIVFPDDVVPVMNAVERAQREGRPFVVEYRLMDRSGEIHWVYEKGQAGYDPYSRSPWLEGVIFDVSERKQAEEELRSYQEHLEELVEERTRDLERSNAALLEEQAFAAGVLENVEDGIVACDRRGELSLYNQAARELYGMAEDPLPLQRWADHYGLFHADGNTPMAPAELPLLRAFRGEVVHQEEMVVYRPGGRRRVLLASGRAIAGVDGRILGAVVSAHDVTAAKESEQERAATALRTRLLYELNRGLPELDESALMAQAVDIAVRVTGSRVGYLHRVGDDQQTLTFAAWNAEAKSGCKLVADSHHPVNQAGIWADALRLRRTVIHNDYPQLAGKAGLPDGHFPVFRHMSTPAVDGDRVRLIVGVGNKPGPYQMRDARQAEVVADEVLKLLMRKRADQALHAAKEEAERANAAKSLFLANMSHELRTPLNAILGFSQMLQNSRAIPAAEQEQLDIINRSGMHLLQLINDVLDMSKIEAGSLQLDPKDFDLGQLVRDTADMMRIRAEEKGLRLILDQSSDFPRFVHGDPARLRQIIINLLGNAVKFSQEGDVVLRLDSAEQADGTLLLRGEVQDKGTGIAEQDIDRVFRPFEQLRESPSQKGTGLGLAITRQFVELMGGKIWVESREGEGSVFRFEVRVEHAGEAVSLEPVTRRGQVIGLAANQPVYRILVAEDQVENQLLMRHLLERVGFEVRIAENGRQAVDLFVQWRPHMIWMDWRMPVLDGLDATREIRRLPGGDRVIIAALTARAFSDQRGKAMGAGLDDFVSKPFRPQDLFDCMARRLGVRFRYHRPELAETAADGARERLAPASLAALPRDFLAALREAAEAGDGEQAKDAIASLEPAHGAVTAALTDLVTEYRYERLVELIDAAVGGGEP